MVLCSICKGKAAGKEERAREIHGNPLVYRRSFVEKQEFKNPLQLFESNEQGILRFQNPLRLKKQALEEEPSLAIELRRLRTKSSADRKDRLNRLASLRKRANQEIEETPSKETGWVQLVDPASGEFYYYNEGSGAAVWECPKHFDEWQ